MAQSYTTVLNGAQDPGLLKEEHLKKTIKTAEGGVVCLGRHCDPTSHSVLTRCSANLSAELECYSTQVPEDTLVLRMEQRELGL